MYRFSKNEKDILKSAYKNLSENGTHRNAFLMKSSKLTYCATSNRLCENL